MGFPITEPYANVGTIKAAELLSTSSHKDNGVCILIIISVAFEQPQDAADQLTYTMLGTEPFIWQALHDFETETASYRLYTAV